MPHGIRFGVRVPPAPSLVAQHVQRGRFRPRRWENISEDLGPGASFVAGYTRPVYYLVVDIAGTPRRRGDPLAQGCVHYMWPRGREQLRSFRHPKAILEWKVAARSLCTVSEGLSPPGLKSSPGCTDLSIKVLARGEEYS